MATDAQADFVSGEKYKAWYAANRPRQLERKRKWMRYNRMLGRLAITLREMRDGENQEGEYGMAVNYDAHR